jgi:hypothetical protein
MATETVRLTLIDGPTLLIEIGGLRFLTDPTFDEPQEHTLGTEVLRKLNPPPLHPESLLPIHAVLLSHDEPTTIWTGPGARSFRRPNLLSRPQVPQDDLVETP